MVYRTILQKDEVERVNAALLSKKLKEDAVKMCEKEYVCSRSQAYIALDPDTYDGKKCHHRCAVDAAVRLLQIHGVNISLCEYQEFVPAT